MIIENSLSAIDLPRQTVLKAAEKTILGDREHDYGSPEKSFDNIAALWNAAGFQRDEKDVVGSDVAIAMTLLKLARLRKTPQHEDSVIDAIGYLANYWEWEEEHESE